MSCHRLPQMIQVIATFERADYPAVYVQIGELGKF